MNKENFKSWRKSLNLTQEEAATRLGMARRQVQKYETGDAEIPLSIALACAAIIAGLEPL